MALVLPSVVYAAVPVDGESVLFSNVAQWSLLMPSARATRYGDYYQDGMITASGEPYLRGSDLCALGPALLDKARQWPIEQLPGAFSVALSWRGLQGDISEQRMWGMTIRLTSLLTGQACYCRVLDTGAIGLEIDLPEGVWPWGDPRDGVEIVQVDLLVSD